MPKNNYNHPTKTATHSESNLLAELSQTIQADKRPTQTTIEAALAPALKRLVVADDLDLARSIQPGNPADFTALTLHRTPTSVLRLHIYAPGASDCDPHTHKGRVRTRLFSGAMTNNEITPLILPENKGDLSVWECGSTKGIHSRVRAPLSAVVDAEAILSSVFLPGESFSVPAGQFHTVADSADPSEITSTLCLFEFDDTCAKEPYVLTAKREPAVPDRTITIAHVRSAMSNLLINGIA